MPLIHVKPNEGMRVRLPSPQAKVVLPNEGKNVEDSSFWRRRELDGEVTISEAQPDPEPPTRGRRPAAPAED